MNKKIRFTRNLSGSTRMGLFIAMFAIMVGLVSTAQSVIIADNFYGTLSINGDPAPAGTEIQGYIGGTDHTFSGPYTTSTAGEYGSLSYNSSLKFRVLGDSPGQTVDFMVEVAPGVFVEADQTGTTYGGGDFNVDLTVTWEGGYVDSDGDGYLSDVDCDDGNENIHPGADELCNDVDDDCDEQIDEGFNLGESCTSGLGICETSGFFVCSQDGLEAVCDAVPGEPEQEVCTDGLDNDCDGLTDCEDVGDCVLHPVCTGVEDICTDQVDNDQDGFTDCEDSDCSEDPACIIPEEYCIEIAGIRILDNDFNEVSTVAKGSMYHVEVTNNNVCEDPIESMQIVKVSFGNTPKNIGTVKSTITPGIPSVVTVGFVMPPEASDGQYDVGAFNWNHWISNDPGTFEILSSPASASFMVA